MSRVTYSTFCPNFGLRYSATYRICGDRMYKLLTVMSGVGEVWVECEYCLLPSGVIWIQSSFTPSQGRLPSRGSP